MLKSHLRELGHASLLEVSYFYFLYLTLDFLLDMVVVGKSPQREEDLDRQILRQIYTNQKLHLFGKDELQMKLFAEEIIELIGKF